MIDVSQATETELPIIRRLAQQIWPNTFKEILTEQQIDYMVEMMYSIESLKSQMNDEGHVFLLAQEKESGEYLGYVSYESGYKGHPITKIHKIYLLPASQGKGIGRKLLDEVADRATSQENITISLNVNRHNKAIQFYERMGFSHVRDEKIDIGQGFIMDDYVMEKALEKNSK